MAECHNERMAEAAAARKRMKRAFLRARNALQASNGPQKKADSAVTTAERTEENWSNCAPLQKALLDAELKLFQLAVSGTLILDNRQKCERSKKDPAVFDICLELDQLFHCLVSKPTKTLRQYVDKRGISRHKRSWAHNMLIKVLHHPLVAFFKVAGILGSALLQHIDDACPHQRLGAGLLHALMYISDCHRYLLEHKKSKCAAELMRIMAPDDAEAHMRVAINFAMIDETMCLAPFFHYCVFLANRQVKTDHAEAVVVSRFVETLRNRGDVEKTSRPSAKDAFLQSFIDVMWSILSEDFTTACEKASREEFSTCLKHCFADEVSQNDMLRFIGSLIFVHHRISPKGNDQGKILPQSDLTDPLVGKVISAIARSVIKSLTNLYQTLRGRKRNRRRAMQKKRKHDGSAAQPVDSETVAHQALQYFSDIDKSIPHLGALSFLSHYWSVSRMAPCSAPDLEGMASTLRNLKKVVGELTKLETATCTTDITTYIGSKIVGGTSVMIPAMSEDLWFCNFYPCRQLKMFRDVQLQEVPLPVVFERKGEDMIRSTIRTLGECTYESAAQGPARRHLDAFSQRCVKDAQVASRSLDKDSLAALVVLTVRKFRIRRLILRLEKVAGGKVSRMAQENVDESPNEGEKDDEQQVVTPLGQPMNEEEEEQDSLHEKFTDRELGAQIRKRRRVMGNCTLAVPDSALVESHSYGSEKTAEQEHADEVRDVGDAKRDDADGKRVFAEGEQRAAEGEREAANRENNGLREQAGVPNMPEFCTEKPVPPTPFPRRASRGGMLSQGSLQLRFAQGTSPCDEEPRAQSKQARERSDSLSQILRNFFYPPHVRLVSPPPNLHGPAFWRNPPPDDLTRNLFSSGHLKGND